MKVTVDEARRIATLARLEFSGDALDRIATELTQILEYVDQLRDAEVADTAVGASTATPMREDTPQPSLDRDAVEHNAPKWGEGFFIVPPVIGGGS